MATPSTVRTIKIVNLVTDNREHERTYSETEPRFCGGHYSLLQGFSHLPEVEVHVVSCTQKPVHSPEKLASNIWFHAPLVPKLGWMRTGYQGCIRAVRRKIRELTPDLVHGHGTERDCGISAAYSGFPNLVTLHGIMAQQARHFRSPFGSYFWLAAKLEKLTIRKTLGVVCNSAYTQENVRPLAKKTWLIPHALRLSFFETAPAEDPRPCVLLNAGVISERKRQLELLDVAAALHRQGLKFEFRFIGFLPPQGSAYAQRFLERIRPMEAAGYARFIGAMPESELVRQYDSVSGVIHFPIEESFGNVTIEALARNLKFFGSRVGGIIDTASQAPAADLFAANDWSGLTEGLAKWIRQGHPRPTDAAAFIRARYHPIEIARRHLEIYQEVLKARS
jgi:glycosyltransferase involved in cell wall biosynthesis